MMNKYNILVIDDDDPIHFLEKGLLGREYNLFNAKNAQEAIDILTTTQINLIISDIHMPGLSGLELLESLRGDEDKSKIPVLIMTNLPTIEKEKKAMELGAADFFKKELFTNDKQKIIDLVRMKLVTNVQISGLHEDLEMSKEQLVMELMESAITGDFEDTVDVLISELNAITKSELTGFWYVGDGKNERVVYRIAQGIEDSNFETIPEQTLIEELGKNKVGYIVNNIVKEEKGTFKEGSKYHNLTSEIAVPICKVNEKELLNNEMNLPDESEIFGVVILKRKVLFSTIEFELVSRLITQTGSILWRLYQYNS